MIRLPARALIVVTAVALVLLAAAPTQGAGFRYGVTAGEITSRSAIVWTRSDRAGRVTLEVSRDRRFRRAVKRYRLRARRSDDTTLPRRVSRLAAGKRYYYRFSRGSASSAGRAAAVSRSARGTFVTAPRTSSNATVEFAFTGDTDFQRQPGQSRPFWNNGEIFRRMQAERNPFNVHRGDTMYSDTEVPASSGSDAPAAPTALTVSQKWARYKQNLANRNLRSLRGAAGLYSHWDDHEFINDFSPRENTFDPSGAAPNVTMDGRTLYRRGVQAFRDFAPITFSNAGGIYRRFRWGRNVELFFLDQRSFRDAKADEGGVCNNPQTGSPDFAPTAPQRLRNVFGAVFPSSGLSQPVSPACLAAIRNTGRTFLGRAQMERFKAAVDRSTATWKLIMNEMPIQQYYALPYDRWEGYEAERQELLTHLRNNVKNVAFLTTDVHATFVNDARFATFPEEGGQRDSGIFDFTVGPASTANFSLEIDDEVRQSGAGNLARDGFFKQPPPNGPGMRCANTDTFSYAQVRATGSSLTVTAKDRAGRPLSDCSPLTIQRTP